VNRKISLGLALAGLTLAASSLVAAGGGNQAMTPVGVWAINYVDDLDPDANNSVIEQYNFGGTMSGVAWSDNKTNSVGNWRKVGRNSYISTTWLMIPDGDGYLKLIEEFWMIDKNTMEGRQEGWWIVGQDPLDPPVPPIGPLWTGSHFYSRLQAEPTQVP